jgi:hypothetical protein
MRTASDRCAARRIADAAADDIAGVARELERDRGAEPAFGDRAVETAMALAMRQARERAGR